MHVPDLRKVVAFMTVLVVTVIAFIAFTPSDNAGRTLRSREHAASRTIIPTRRIQPLSTVDGFSFHPMTQWGKYKKKKDGPTLPLEVVNRVENFLMFVGYPRSGHSIIGSLLDAHPHIAIAHEYMLMANWKYLSDREKTSDLVNPFMNDKDYLFNVLYRQSFWDSQISRSEKNSRKNYTLDVDYPWQGAYDKYLSIIGDKSGGMTTNVYLNSSDTFPQYLEELKRTVKVPVKVIHAVRNPFDLISTYLLYRDCNKLPLIQTSRGGRAVMVSSYKSEMAKLQAKGDKKAFAAARYDAESRLKMSIDELVRKARAVGKIINMVGSSNVLEIHNRDLVSDPKTTMSKICSFLEVNCTPDYLNACVDKVFTTVSKTRSLLVWPPNLKRMVNNQLIEKFPFFRRYSFESE